MGLINKSLLREILNNKKVSLTNESYAALEKSLHTIIDRACIRCRHKAPDHNKSHLKAIHI